MSPEIKTSVIGSYPIHIDGMELMSKYFDQTEISWKKYIKNAVSDMIAAGIDIISDGQTRDPFVQIFTRKFKGCRIRERTEIIGKIEYNDPITIDDQKYTRSLIPDNVELIGLITGPYTLTKSCVDLFYNDEKEIAFDFAYGLQQEANALQEYVDIISIDEPFFSMGIPDYGKELIEIITKDISCPTRLHVCGDISEVIPEVLDMPVDILSHEFKASPHLFNSFKEYSVSKKICVGAVRSDDPRIESVDEIVDHIRKAFDVFGEQIVQLAPDCGQRMLSKNVAFQKLKNLVMAGERIK